MTWDVVALALGVIVAVGLALIISPLADQTDESMVWEGRVAVGFGAIAFIGPFWLAQGAATVVATFVVDGVAPLWLWAWFVAAPLVGLSPPAAAVARAVLRMFHRRSSTSYSSRGVAAAQQEANFAWAATQAGQGWELRRTPPLAESWPPRPGGPVVWLCYAERPGPADAVEVAAPWARVTLAPGPAGWPVVERLADAVQSIGVQPVATSETVANARLLDALRRGDPEGSVAKSLAQWRTHNMVLAAHPAVAGRLPPV